MILPLISRLSTVGAGYTAHFSVWKPPFPSSFFYSSACSSSSERLAAFGQNSAARASSPASLELLTYGGQCPLNLSARQGYEGQLGTPRPGQQEPSA